MDFNSFLGDLRRRASNNHLVDLGFTGFPSTSSSSNGFQFSSDRESPITNPLPNHHNLNTVASMADIYLGLRQNLSNMSISEEDGERRSTFTGFRPFLDPSSFGSRNLDGRLSREQDLRARREALLQSFNGEASMDGYVDNGYNYRLRLLGLQGFANPNPNPRGFMYPPDASMMYNGGNRVLLPPISAIEGSRELESMNKKLFFQEDLQDFSLNLTSMVDIHGSVYLMAKDQMGSRFLQRLIEEGSFVDVMIIFREVINHVIELGMDPSGNYLIQKLLQVCNEEQRTQILIMMTSNPGLLVNISINTYGTRVVQKLIQTMRTKEQISLVKSALKPGLIPLIKDVYGNHVISHCLKSFHPYDNEFIFEAATKSCVEIATDRYGCCVLQHCVSYSVEAQREKLVAEISRHSLHLAQDLYGNYVVQYLLEQMEGVNAMFELRGNYVKLASQKFGSHVVERCLKCCPESRFHIVRELVSVPEFEHLLQDPYANYVIQSAISFTKGFVRMSLMEKVRKCRNLETSPYCQRIFSKCLLKK